MTIEERADAYVGHHFEIDEFSSTTAKRQAFIDGAKDERRILTNKVWKYLSEKLKPAVLGTDGLVVLEGGINEEEFRKLMMEE